MCGRETWTDNSQRKQNSVRRTHKRERREMRIEMSVGIARTAHVKATSCIKSSIESRPK